jgi:hypothetical protein
VPYPIVTGIRPERTVVSFDRLRINHYGTKSEEELRRKWELWRKGGTMRPELPGMRLTVSGIYERYESIARWVPALRDALGVTD